GRLPRVEPLFLDRAPEPLEVVPELRVLGVERDRLALDAAPAADEPAPGRVGPEGGEPVARGGWLRGGPRRGAGRPGRRSRAPLGRRLSRRRPRRGSPEARLGPGGSRR